MSPWKQMTAVVGIDGERFYRPMYGDGTVGEQDPDLKPNAIFAVGEDDRTVYPNKDVLCQPYVRTPWGTAKGVEDSYPIGRSPAEMACMRAIGQGHFRLYTREYAYWMILNEGVEYGITSYTSPEHFSGRTRKLMAAARRAIEARDDRLSIMYGDCEGVEVDPYDRTTLALINEAERAKIAFLRHIYAPDGETPHENEPFTDYTIKSTPGSRETNFPATPP